MSRDNPQCGDGLHHLMELSASHRVVGDSRASLLTTTDINRVTTQFKIDVYIGKH